VELLTRYLLLVDQSQEIQDLVALEDLDNKKDFR
jgi:hypothetical protein